MHSHGQRLARSLGRLRKRPQFLAAAAGNRKWASRGLVLQALKQPCTENLDGIDCAETHPNNGIRIGFTASRRVGNAVARNRAKRRLRAVAAEILPVLAAHDTDYVLIARGTTLNRSYDDLLADLRLALKKVNALRDRQKTGKTGDLT